MLAVTVGAPQTAMEHTRGLLGNYNGDMTDDLTAADGSQLDVNADLKTIHESFGQTCK